MVKAINWDPSMSKDPNAPFNQQDPECEWFEHLFDDKWFFDTEQRHMYPFVEIMADFIICNTELKKFHNGQSIFIHCSACYKEPWYKAFETMLIYYLKDELEDFNESELNASIEEVKWYLRRWKGESRIVNYSLQVHIEWVQDIDYEKLNDEREAAAEDYWDGIREERMLERDE